jgi:uncharacterized Zn-binding protein involved in type VI secretion
MKLFFITKSCKNSLQKTVMIQDAIETPPAISRPVPKLRMKAPPIFFSHPASEPVPSPGATSLIKSRPITSQAPTKVNLAPHIPTGPPVSHPGPSSATNNQSSPSILAGATYAPIVLSSDEEGNEHLKAILKAITKKDKGKGKKEGMDEEVEEDDEEQEEGKENNEEDSVKGEGTKALLSSITIRTEIKRCDTSLESAN